MAVGKERKWDKYEAAILLDGYLRKLNGEGKNKDIVQKVSDDLRTMAVNRGDEISDVYRNTNGINMQLSSMESAYAGHTVNMRASKLFTEIADLYRNDRTAFDLILKEAQRMAGYPQSNKTQFFNYLETRFSPELAKVYRHCAETVDSFGKTYKILDRPLLETNDIEIIAQLQHEIERNKIFAVTHRKHYSELKAICRIYLDYLQSDQAEQNEPAAVEPAAFEGVQTQEPDDSPALNSRSEEPEDVAEEPTALTPEEVPADEPEVGEEGSSEEPTTADELPESPPVAPEALTEAEIPEKVPEAEASAPEESLKLVEEILPSPETLPESPVEPVEAEESEVVPEESEKPDQTGAEPHFAPLPWLPQEDTAENAEPVGFTVRDAGVEYQVTAPELKPERADDEPAADNIKPTDDEPAADSAEPTDDETVPDSIEPTDDTASESADTTDAPAETASENHLPEKAPLPPLEFFSVAPVRTDSDRRLASRYGTVYQNIFRRLYTAYGTDHKGVSAGTLRYTDGAAIRPAVLEDIVDNASWIREDKGRFFYHEEAETAAEAPAAEPEEPKPQDKNLHVMTLSRVPDMTGVVPLSIALCGETANDLSSWRDLLANAAAILMKHYPEIVRPDFMVNENGKLALLIAEKSKLSRLRVPRAIPGTEYHIETIYSPVQIVEMLRTLTSCCQLPPESVEICFTIKGGGEPVWPAVTEKPVIAPNEPLQTSPSPAEPSPKTGSPNIHDAELVGESFKLFLVNECRLQRSSANTLLSSIRTVEGYAREHKYEPYSLLAGNATEILSVLDRLDGSPFFRDYNAKQRNRFTPALTRYREYVNSGYFVATPQPGQSIVTTEEPKPEPEPPKPVPAAPKPTEVPAAPSRSTPMTAYLSRRDVLPSEERFAAYVMKREHFTGQGAEKMISRLRELEQLAAQWGLTPFALFAGNRTEIRACLDGLAACKDFTSTDIRKAHVYSRALQYFVRFLDSGDFLASAGVSGAPGTVSPEPISQPTPQPTPRPAPPVPAAPKPASPKPAPAAKPVRQHNEKYETVLRETFPRGFRYDSAIDCRKFRRRYAEKFGTELTAEDAALSAEMKQLGVVYDGKVFHPDTVLNAEQEKSLLAYIRDTFAGGTGAIFYQALFDQFSGEWLDSQIFDADMLKAYLAFIDDGRLYYIAEKQLTRERGVAADPRTEILAVLKDNGGVMTVGELSRVLPHIPMDTIRSITKAEAKCIGNSVTDEYFHIDSFYMSVEDRNAVARALNKALWEFEYLSTEGLRRLIQEKVPDVADNNIAFSDTGFRRALEYHLGDNFSFGAVISEKGKDLSVSDVFAAFARNREEFTLDDLNDLKREVDTASYQLDRVCRYAYRVNETRFVSRRSIEFPAAEIDAALEILCPGNYISLQKLDNFTLFPYVGYPWNCYLLQQYLYAEVSQKFLHIGSLAATACNGVVVRKSSGITDMDGLIVAVLADQPEMEEKEALRYLADEGYLTRNRYSGMAALQIRARELRNRKEEK